MVVPTRKIKLTQGKYALVDASDFDSLNQWKWYYGFGYAIRGQWENGGRKTILMHKLINKTPEGCDTDHINLDRLDNRRENIRTCTRSQNIINRRVQANNSSGYKGVFWKKSHKKWVAQASVDGKPEWLGHFDSPVEAAKAHDKRTVELFGEFALTNRKLGLIS